MPWKVQGNCVHKENPDGSLGEMVKCHDTPEQAMEHMKALYANEPATAEESAPPAKRRTSDLHEVIDLSEAALDEATFTVKGVRLIQAGWSRNDRYYPDTVLGGAAGLWENAKAYADHPSKDEQKSRPERSVRDIVGYYSGVRHDSPRTLADMKIVGEARGWLWPLIQETVSTGVPLVGLSIRGLGTTRLGEVEGRRGAIVEAITHAHSVDVVTDPAAGGGFDHLAASGDGGWTEAVLKTMTLDELREARPDLIADLKREWKTTRDSQAMEAARAEIADLRHQLDAGRTAASGHTEELRTLHAALKEARVDRLLDRATDLPEKWRDSLRDDLLHAEESAWSAIVERESQKLAAVRGKVPVDGAGRLSPVLDAPATPLPARSTLVAEADLSYSDWLARRKPQR